MAKRLVCTFCTERSYPQTGWQKQITVPGQDDVYLPAFRGKRQLARHLEKNHSQDKVALKFARELIVRVREWKRGAR